MLGHEGCGEVIQSARSDVNTGTMVTWSVTDVCGQCDNCEYGPQQKCGKLMKYGHVEYQSGTVPRQGI